MHAISRVLVGAALSTYLLAACSTEPDASRNLVVRAALGLEVPHEVYALGVYAERLDAHGKAISSFGAEVNADETHFVAPFDVIPNVGAQPGDRVRITVVAYAPPKGGAVRALAMRRAELAWPADGRMLRLGLTKGHVNNVFNTKLTLPVSVETAAAFALRHCPAQETEDDGARCVPLTSIARDLPAVDPESPPPDACLPATCFANSDIPVCNGYEPCSLPALSYGASSTTARDDGSCSIELAGLLDEGSTPTFVRLEAAGTPIGAFSRPLTPSIDYTVDRPSRTVIFSPTTCEVPRSLGFIASAQCEPPSTIATALCGARTAKDALPMPQNANTFLLAPSQTSLSFGPLPFDEPPSMLAVVGHDTVYAVLGSENRLWLRPGSTYYAGHQWGPAVSFERDGAAFQALHGYPSTPPRVYVAQRDARLRPVTIEGIGAPVEFCTPSSSCRTTADVVSVAGPNGARGAVWMVRDPDGIAFYTEESTTRFVRSALAPIAGASRVLELADDPPGVATVIEREGAWRLVRLAADAATVRDELPLPDGLAYVHFARGESAFGKEAVDALHVLVAGNEGGEAALQIAPGELSLSWRWRASVSADASWYGRSFPAWSSPSGARAGCYLSSNELLCRNAEDEVTSRTADVLAACQLREHRFALRKVAAGTYAAEVAAYDGPTVP
jgi:hypothetical protein